MKAFIVYPTYETIDNQTYIYLFGRLENNQSFLTINKFNPYFYIQESNLKKIQQILKKIDCKIQKTNLTTFKNKKVIKLSFSTQTELNKTRHEIHNHNIPTYEGDIKPAMRFMIDKNLLGTINIEGEYLLAREDERVDRIYKEPELTNSEHNPKLKIASIDLETNNLGKLVCIGIYSADYKKEFFITNSTSKFKHTIICKNEEECLEKFKQEILELDPDIITGWNVIDFDLSYLKEKFQKNKIKFDLGRTNQQAKIRIESNFFRKSSCDIPGRLVLDGMNLLQDPLIQNSPTMKKKKIESYSLENISQVILEKGKTLKGSGLDRVNQITTFLKTDPQKVIDYNLMDCQLVYEILEKTGIINLAIQRSQLTGLSLDKLSGSIAAFDSLYIRNAKKQNLVSPTSTFTEKQQRITGGFVMSPKPGIYNNVLVLDFKSLYPSIIRTFNIDPASFLESKTQDSITNPSKTYFKNKEGVLPGIIETLHKAREKAKKQNNQLASYAIKIIMNSFFGVLASPNCRYFSLDLANSITKSGQELIKITAKQIQEKHNLNAIYGDTDSIFINTGLTKEKANQLGKQIESEINSFYKTYIKQNYKTNSYLELEFEKQYLKFLIPKLRQTESSSKEGAKKRYAGLKEIKTKDDKVKEEIEIVGMEAIRGDWTHAAQEFQIKLLEKIFHEQNPIVFIKEYIKDLKSGKLDQKLIYKKSIRKGLEEYTKTTPPHVKAARKLEKAGKPLDSSTIRYYITTDGPEPIQLLKHKIDYEHYIDKQIKPIAIQILSLLNTNFEDILKGSKQSTLF